MSPSARCATSRRGSPTSTPARSVRRCTCPSAASRAPATATARPARPRWTSSPSGSRSTSTTRGSSRRHRSTRPSSVTRVNRKLVVFVPREALDTVREALFEAGAGRIGNYERCSFYTEGTGTFFGGEGTDPDVGQAGREQRVAELRLETVFPEERQGEGGEALRRAHPYEAPALDAYPLLGRGASRPAAAHAAPRD